MKWAFSKIWNTEIDHTLSQTNAKEILEIRLPSSAYINKIVINLDAIRIFRQNIIFSTKNWRNFDIMAQIPKISKIMKIFGRDKG